MSTEAVILLSCEMLLIRTRDTTVEVADSTPVIRSIKLLVSAHGRGLGALLFGFELRPEADALARRPNGDPLSKELSRRSARSSLSGC